MGFIGLIGLGKGNRLSNVMPHFKFHYVDISGRRSLCIETGGRIIHEILNLQEFYSEFGYRAAPGQPDELPDEFIWSEYVNNPAADFSPCIQIHILQYLKKHSDVFNMEFAGQFENLIADHVKAKGKTGISCIACRLNPAHKV